MLVSIASKMTSTEITPGLLQYPIYWPSMFNKFSNQDHEGQQATMLVYDPDKVARNIARYHYAAAICLNIVLVLSSNHVFSVFNY